MRYTETFANPSFTRASDGGKMPNDSGWQTQHMAALRAPKRVEAPIVSMIHAWAAYADTHRACYGGGIGEDGVLGVYWADMAKALKGLLDGAMGRLDGGTLSSFISDTLLAEGFNPDDL